MLTMINELEIFVLMDNVSDPFTTNDSGVYWNEGQYRSQIRKQKGICGSDCCRACNGLSLFIKVKDDQTTHTILFDTGPDQGLIVENAKRLGLNLAEVDAIILSHGHFDHYGGTLSALQAINKPNMPVYAHPEVFIPRAWGDLQKANLEPSKNTLTMAEIVAHGGKVVTTSKPFSLCNNTILISGEIPRHTSYESGLPDEFKMHAGEWVSAPEVLDEQCLFFNLKNKGLVVITGCGHTGIINAARYAMKTLNSDKIHLLMGGFHLAEPELYNRVAPTIADLKKINPDYIATGHCTGRRTQAELSDLFCDRHIPYGVGARFIF